LSSRLPHKFVMKYWSLSRATLAAALVVAWIGVVVLAAE
jgi:hypothetical protein